MRGPSSNPPRNHEATHPPSRRVEMSRCRGVEVSRCRGEKEVVKQSIFSDPCLLFPVYREFTEEIMQTALKIDEATSNTDTNSTRYKAFPGSRGTGNGERGTGNGERGNYLAIRAGNRETVAFHKVRTGRTAGVVALIVVGSRLADPECQPRRMPKRSARCRATDRSDDTASPGPRGALSGRFDPDTVWHAGKTAKRPSRNLLRWRRAGLSHHAGPVRSAAETDSRAGREPLRAC